jgi:hypothetical protein
MKLFLELLKESVILQAILTTGIWGAVIFLVLSGRAVPDNIYSAANLVLGFYFGSKLAMMQRIAYHEANKKGE